MKVNGNARQMKEPERTWKELRTKWKVEGNQRDMERNTRVWNNTKGNKRKMKRLWKEMDINWQERERNMKGNRSKSPEIKRNWKKKKHQHEAWNQRESQKHLSFHSFLWLLLFLFFCGAWLFRFCAKLQRICGALGGMPMEMSVDSYKLDRSFFMMTETNI